MRIVAVFYALFFGMTLFGQDIPGNGKIDSIEKILRERIHDTVRIYSLLELANQYQDIDLEKATARLDEVYGLLRQQPYAKGWNYYYVLKCREYIYRSKLDIALTYAVKAQKSASKSHDVPKYVYGCYYEAIIYSYKNENLKCIVALKKLLKYLAGKKNEKELAALGDIYVTLGGVYSLSNNYDLSLGAFTKAIPLFRKRKDMLGIHHCYYEIAQVYLLTKNYEKALEYCNKAITINHTWGNYTERDNLTDLTLLATIYLNLNKTDAALRCLDQALVSYKKAGGESDKWYLLNSITAVNIAAKNYKKVIALCKKELNIPKAIDENVLLLYSSMALSYSELGNTKAALYYVDLLFSLLEKNTDIYVSDGNKIQLHNNARQVYNTAHDYKKAFYHLQKSMTMTEKRQEEINKQKILVLQEEFNTKEKEIQINDLKIKEQKKRFEIEQQKNKQYILLSVLLLAGVLLFAIAYSRFTIKKKNVELKLLNTIIVDKNEDLEKSRLSLQKLLKEKDVLLKEIHHRVKNNLQLVMSLLNIQSRVNTHPAIADFLHKGRSRIASMALIHQNLYLADAVNKVDFDRYLTELVDSIVYSYEETTIPIKFNIEVKDIFFDIQTAIPLGLIMNELISNSLKHAFFDRNEGTITIKSWQNNAVITIEYNDNGIGVQTQGVSKKEKSMGLKIVALLIKQLKGQLVTENRNGLHYKIIINPNSALDAEPTKIL